MPPKRNLADSMQEVTQALKSRNNDYQQLYEAPANNEPNVADIIRERDEKAKKRRKLINNSTVLHVGPKFRDQHVTKFRATNASVIESEGRQEGSLYEYVVDGKVILKLLFFLNFYLCYFIFRRHLFGYDQGLQ